MASFIPNQMLYTQKEESVHLTFLFLLHNYASLLLLTIVIPVQIKINATTITHGEL